MRSLTISRSLFLGGATALALGRRALAAPAETPLDPATPIPVVVVDVGGRRLRMMLDTGDGISVVSAEAASAAGVTTTPVEGQPALRRGTLRAMLGGTALRDHPVLVSDVADLRALTGVAVDGSLGYAAFIDRIVRIDYRGGRVALPAAPPQDVAGVAITWLQYHERSPKLVTFDGLTIDGQAVTAQFDTAMRHAAIVFSTKLPGMHLAPVPNAAAYTYEEASLTPARAASIGLAGRALATAATVYVAGANAHIPTTAITAVAGDELFAGHAVTIDFAGARLFID